MNPAPVAVVPTSRPGLLFSRQSMAEIGNRVGARIAAHPAQSAARSLCSHSENQACQGPWSSSSCLALTNSIRMQVGTCSSFRRSLSLPKTQIR